MPRVRVSRWKLAACVTVAAPLPLPAVAHEPAKIGYVVGAHNAEDLIAVPGTRWLVASGLEEPGRPGGLHLVDREARTAAPLVATDSDRVDAAAYPDCPGPPKTLSAHGVSLRPGTGGKSTLYVMNHSGREAVEVFALDHSGKTVTLRWTGCVPLPPGALGNGVAALPGGGIVATLMNAPEYFDGPAGADHPERWVPRLSSGATTGYAASWRAGEGWRKIAGTEGSGPNGIETSPDGRWVYVALWGNRRIVRAPLGEGERSAVELTFMPDNIHWGDDGRLWIVGAAGAPDDYFTCWATKGCRNDYAIAGLDPATLSVRMLEHPDTRPTFGDATGGVLSGGEFWIAAHPGDRIGVLPVPHAHP